MTFGFVAVSESESTSRTVSVSFLFSSVLVSFVVVSVIPLTTVLVSVVFVSVVLLTTELASETSFAETLLTVAIDITNRPNNTEPVIPWIFRIPNRYLLLKNLRILTSTFFFYSFNYLIITYLYHLCN